MKRQFFAILFFCWAFIMPAQAQSIKTEDEPNLAFVDKEHYVSAAMQLDDYLPLLEGKQVGVVGNQTSIIGETHLVDTLLSLGINIRKIYTPEHGFRGTADAGAKVNSGKDEKTGLPIVSLYGKNKKPTAEMLQGIDVILFDLQDVGVRFYTYISTMSYVMEAAAENHIPVIVLDRPNPNGFYVDGPVLRTENKSFVGMHEVPVVYGMTIGEYAKMVNGEGWLKGDITCDLTVIPIKEYNRNAIYELPVKPSPNLPNWESVYLYPTLCFFEGTNPFEAFPEVKLAGIPSQQLVFAKLSGIKGSPVQTGAYIGHLFPEEHTEFDLEETSPMPSDIPAEEVMQNVVDTQLDNDDNVSDDDIKDPFI